MKVSFLLAKILDYLMTASIILMSILCFVFLQAGNYFPGILLLVILFYWIREYRSVISLITQKFDKNINFRNLLRWKRKPTGVSKIIDDANKIHAKPVIALVAEPVNRVKSIVAATIAVIISIYNSDNLDMYTKKTLLEFASNIIQNSNNLIDFYQDETILQGSKALVKHCDSLQSLLYKETNPETKKELKLTIAEFKIYKNVLENVEEVAEQIELGIQRISAIIHTIHAQLILSGLTKEKYDFTAEISRIKEESDVIRDRHEALDEVVRQKIYLNFQER